MFLVEVSAVHRLPNIHKAQKFIRDNNLLSSRLGFIGYVDLLRWFGLDNNAVVHRLALGGFTTGVTGVYFKSSGESKRLYSSTIQL